MKRLFILAIGLGLVSSNTYTTPFYMVQCYDSKYKVVSCDDKAKVAKTKKIARVFKKKSAKKETVAERKARERAMALRALAKQNETLKGELDSLRRANLIASAQTSVTPTAQAAPVIQANVPAPTPMPTAATQIAKSVEPEEQSAWGFEVANLISKPFNDTQDDKKATVSSPLQNELDLIGKYKPTKNMIFNVEEDLYWNWNNTTNAANNGFDADNPAFYFDYLGLYVSESKQTTIDGEIKVIPGVKQDARDAGMVAQFYLRGIIKTKFNDGKGYFKFEPEVDPIINKYSTSAPTATTATDEMPVFDGLAYERLTPNTRFAVAMQGSLGHKIMEGVTLETQLKFTSSNTFANEIIDSGGITRTLVPAGGFKPFSTDANNSLTFLFIMDYEI
ncbi:MAG: hypothetical protein NTY22_09800 [Proteobacteria bacterium]|nr:hypothetical protein [Pseudomonadota bacterium]